ncbi:hypothetical protein FOCC_FOCC011557 [Frankliniella occidentalis]|nr:hypothetical protein FOCC_FOCC011557 [Frankliniella occidentalis]
MPPEALVAHRARDLRLGLLGVALLGVEQLGPVLREVLGLVRLGLNSVPLPRLVPASVGSQVSGAVEHLVALRAAVLHVHDARTPMLRQREGVVVELAAQPTHVVADLVLDGCQLGLGLLGHFHYVEGRVDVTFAHHERVTVLLHHFVDVPDDGAGHGGALVLVERQLPDGLGLLGRGATAGLGRAGRRPPLGRRRDAARRGARRRARRHVVVDDALIVVVAEVELGRRQGGVAEGDAESVALAAGGRGGRWRGRRCDGRWWHRLHGQVEWWRRARQQGQRLVAGQPLG